MNSYIQKGTPQYWRAISALFLGSLAAFGVIYCTQPLIPVFSREFNLTPAVSSLAMSFASGGMAVAMFAIACLAGSLDRKLTMVISILGSALLVIPITLSSDFTTIVVCRAAQGVFAAGFPAIAMAYINEEFAPEIRGLVIGIYVSGTSIGGLSSRLIVSTITDFFSWKVALASIGLVGLLISVWFYLAIPKSKHFLPHHHSLRTIASDLVQNLRHPIIIRLYVIAFAILGAFMAVYNYIGYPLMAPPYNLSQTAVGALFTLYLIGTFSSTFMGGLSDRFGPAKILSLSIFIMLCGGLITLMSSLVIKIAGLAVFTFGFFGSHSVASSWVGKCCPGDKARAASLYLLFYYFGASVVGTVGGLFLAQYGWPGVVLIAGLILGGALLLSRMLYSDDSVMWSQAHH
ncbi:Inner membrane transport protein YnfM [bioreactor metagenome]|uniref:Inner membrane transport protein YnfM n=1 Tax=bioreactor metagenome TaxID=1076179 RepID=A0A644SXC4_9ZZZZ|nr:MFS transporter [Negativicutes bacterium]